MRELHGGSVRASHLVVTGSILGASLLCFIEQHCLVKSQWPSTKLIWYKTRGSANPLDPKLYFKKSSVLIILVVQVIFNDAKFQYEDAQITWDHKNNSEENVLRFSLNL